MKILIHAAWHRVFSLSQLSLVCNVEMWINPQRICILTKHDVDRVSQMSLPCIMSTSGFNIWAETGPRASWLESTTSINHCIYLVVPRACHYVMLNSSTDQFITWLIIGDKKWSHKFFFFWRFCSIWRVYCTNIWVNGLVSMYCVFLKLVQIHLCNS